MEIDPMETVEGAKEKHKDRLNSWVALTVALLATFMGICSVKAGNIAQAMQQKQADKIDNWSFFQAKSIREEIARTTASQLELMALSAPAAQKQAYLDRAAEFRQAEARRKEEKKEPEGLAKQADKDYENLNKRDDQFDISEAMISIAIALLALCSLTEKRILFFLALFPTGFGVVMGCAGLFGWPLYADKISSLLGA